MTIGDKELLMLAPGIAQKIDQCCAKDEAFQQTHSAQQLPAHLQESMGFFNFNFKLDVTDIDVAVEVELN